jgi:hypothetical protein
VSTSDIVIQKSHCWSWRRSQRPAQGRSSWCRNKNEAKHSL